MASSLPLRRELDSTTFTDIVGRPVEPRFRPNGRMRIVNPELFESLGMRVRFGRGFTVDDRAGSEPVMMVNEAWVAKFLPPGTDPLRERIAGLVLPSGRQQGRAAIGRDRGRRRRRPLLESRQKS